MRNQSQLKKEDEQKLFKKPRCKWNEEFEEIWPSMKIAEEFLDMILGLFAILFLFFHSLHPMAPLQPKKRPN